MKAATVRKSETKRVGVWLRVSTEDQAKGESPEHHEKRARMYAESKDWQVVEVYHLEGVSGKTVIARSETQRMLEDIRRGHITGLIFSKLARLARNTKELLEFAEIFEIHGAHLISLQESIDTSTPAGRFFYTMIAAMAQWEREEIAERIKASIPIRAKLGKPLSGTPPFGYVWKDRKLVPEPKEAPIRKLVYDLYLEHQRKLTVAKLLNEAGYRTRSGKPFSHQTVERMLCDTTAKGLFRQNYTHHDGSGQRALKPESEWVYTEVEPIVSEETWARCQEIMANQREGQTPRARKPVSLFAGVTYCATCQEKMYVPSNTPKYVCQTCRRKIPMVDLEAIFCEQLKSFFVSQEDIASYLTQADEAINDKKQLLTTLEQEEAKIKAEMDDVYQLYISHQISGEGFAARYGPLEDRYRQIDDQIPRLQGEVDYLRINHLSSDEVAQEAQDLYNRWPKLDHADKRKVIEAITAKIEVGADDITVELCYLPTSKIVATSSISPAAG